MYTSFTGLMKQSTINDRKKREKKSLYERMKLKAQIKYLYLLRDTTNTLGKQEKKNV